MTEIRDNNFSKLCEGKGELLSKALRDRILEQDFMRKSKFPIIVSNKIIAPVTSIPICGTLYFRCIA